MLMPESVLAAIIAGTATLSASYLQLKSALLREAQAARGPSAAARRRKRVQLIILLVIIGGSAAGGFALSQWLTAGERAAQQTMQHELQTRVAELSHTADQLEIARAAGRAEIENEVLRRLGNEGVVVMATVPACHPLHPPDPAAADAVASGLDAGPPVPAGRGCSETQANSVVLCATVPAAATITEVELFSRFDDSDLPWSTNRLLPGQESAQARFQEKYTESTPSGGTRQVCQGFAHWSAEHARVARMVVRYSL
jgi:hypothetical protein